MVKGNLPTDVVRTGYHREYETFNYETAQKAYYMQRHPEEKYKGMQLLGALYIINMLSGNKSPNKTQTQWDLYNDAQKAVIHEHDNAK